MNFKAVVGLGFGDEGKGKTVDYLCARNLKSIVIRYSGGHQVGHTVISREKNIKHVFSNFGSGTLRGVPTYWSEFCTVDPLGIVTEAGVLESKGIRPTLYVHPKCPVTTPYEKYFNMNHSFTLANGSCGVGVNATYKRESSNYSLLFEDIFYPTILKVKLAILEQYYRTELHLGITKIMKADVDMFLDCCTLIASGSIKYVSMSTINALPEAVEDDRILIFEGSQGLLLDQNFGFYPNVTPASTGTVNILQIVTSLENQLKHRGWGADWMHTHFPKDIGLFLVTRAYATRHGNGPMSDERKLKLSNTDDETNIKHKYQGNFRTGALDISWLEYAIQKDEYIKNKLTSVGTTLVFNHIDQFLESKGTHREVQYKDGYSLNSTSPVHLGLALLDRLHIKNILFGHGPDSLTQSSST